MVRPLKYSQDLLPVWTVVGGPHENGMLVATINALDEDFVCRHKLFYHCANQVKTETLIPEKTTVT